MTSKGRGAELERTAIVINMFYTGLGIARSLGEQGVRVIGLSAHRGVYGNFTRYADVRRCPDSREDPVALRDFLLQLRDAVPGAAVIFPTRDDDLYFLNRFRQELSSHYTLLLPEPAALEICLDKWQTFVWARAAGVPIPQCWRIETEQDLDRIAAEAKFPCVLKPVSARDWRQGANWNLVGNRKAIKISSSDELAREYKTVKLAKQQALLQELVPGPDDNLYVAACYLNRQSKFVAGFTAQKLIQVPEGFGTGCVVQTVNRPELLAQAGKLLESMGFSGIAEVEFKWDAADREFKLIEVNPRPWDQHRLGEACGVNLVAIAFRDLAGLGNPPTAKQTEGHRWIADDVFVMLLLRSIWKLDGRFTSSLRMASQPRTHAIWSGKDPLPALGYFAAKFVPELVRTGFAALRSLLTGMVSKMLVRGRKSSYESQLEKAK